MKFEPDKIRHPKKRAFLVAFAKCGQVYKSAGLAKVSGQTHYAWLKDDPQYASEFQRAMDAYTALLEAEADRRAVTGVLEPVFQGGVKVGSKRRFSDTLLIFRLKALAPEKYRERIDQKTTLSGKVEISRAEELSDDELARIAAKDANGNAASSSEGAT